MKLFGKHVWKMAGLLLMVSLISLAVISGTFAKYTSILAGQDTALVAKWKITGGTGTTLEMDKDGNAQLNLFEHSYDKDIVKTASGHYIIAPGVKGNFVLKFKNESDVAAKVSFDSIEVSGDAPIKYSLTSTGTPGLTAEQLRGELNDEANTNGGGKLKKIAETNGNASVTVYWEWPSSWDTPADEAALADIVAADDADNVLGKASAAAADRTTYILKIKATAVQMEPTDL